jgi:iron(III) transport system ATP-binding protein
MPFGEVTDVEFAGAVCTLSVRLIHDADRALVGSNDRAAPDAPLQLRRPSIDVPPVGAIVRIAVVGTAHVFEEA